MLDPIPHISVMSILSQYDTDGHSPYQVLGQEFEPYVLKTFKNAYDRPSLIKEFLCPLLLKCWDIESPSVATLSLSPELKKTQYVINNKGFTYSNTYFGSKFIADSIDLQEFITVKGKVALKRILNPDELLDIALFDIWTENDDRKPSNSNLLLCPSGESLIITPIDHAHTFASLQFNQINPNYVSFSNGDSIAYSPFGQNVVRHFNINANWLSEAKEKFYIRTSKTEKIFQQICAVLPPEFQLTNEEIEKLSRFLFNSERNKEVFDQFTYIVSSIK